ncbi:putative short-chain dehydrogenase/reductase family 42E member 2 [Varanus komodoensis]|uniref:putative short-chain dehydrogenase/reductase family 42E member 2 n=1 Tax=Varanus komodoensis TaxID=61221 RepID=UPI001CF7A9F7|nr:putative short-chain dehydrogenase/reductase family 42E member 2 [Varanus komodoensis]
MEKAAQKDRKSHMHAKQVSKAVEPKPDTSKQTLQKVSNKTVITGGAGNFGFTLGRAFAKTGTHVILYDINQPPWEIPKGVVHIQADVRNYDDLYAACEGADCVIHAASYGMTGVEQLYKKQIRSVNVGGTGVVLEVCKRRNVPRLIYTSSINVVFAGQTILDGDEASVPYYPLNKHRNEYSRTKSIAEQMVLAANGSFLAGGGKLYTCALRPPGIYGPEEQRHLPRLALIIERGFFLFKLGSSDVLMNWVHVKNLVQAHILAAAALTPEKNYIAGGQAYFIHDDEKVNLFEWLSPLFEGLGVSKPWMRLPIWLAQLSALIMESVVSLVTPFLELVPLITMYEVHSVACTHTFKIDKARAHLGYAPKKYLFADCIEHLLKKRPRQKNYFWLNVFFLMVFLIGAIVLALKSSVVVNFLQVTWENIPQVILENMQSLQKISQL